MTLKQSLGRIARDLAHWTGKCVRWPLEVVRPVRLSDRGIAAHRGASETHPENTRSALREAIELGVQQIEFDVRQTKDRKLVVLHDKTLERTTNGQGAVNERMHSEITALDAGAWKHPRFAGERIPTLAWALHLIPRDVWINIHVKGPPSLAKRAAFLVYVLGRTHQAFLSVKADSARVARKAVPGIKICCMDRGENTDDYIARAVAMQADFIQLLRENGMPSKESIERAHRAGLKVNYCTAINEEEIKELFDLGVDFPMLDDPGIASGFTRLQVRKTFWTRDRLPSRIASTPKRGEP